MNRFGFFLFAAGCVLVGGASPVRASFHFMQIEQVIGGVNGDATAQAVQLRQRSAGQNLVTPSRIRVFNAAGLSPITFVNFNATVTSGVSLRRILVATPSFLSKTTPATVDDVTVVVNPIPASYLAAGSMTFETDDGLTIYWRLSWGGSSYTGPMTGSITNDSDGNFGVWPGALPSGCTSALLFMGPAGGMSTNNSADYALTVGPAIFTNNATTAFAVNPCAVDADCNDGLTCTTEVCSAGCCMFTPNNAACDDFGFCTGTETCQLVTGCASSGNPCGGATPFCDESADICGNCSIAADCNDGIACTSNACVAGNCQYTPNDAFCNDALFCTGVETCSPVTGCVASGDPCIAGQICDEAGDACNDARARIQLALVVGAARTGSPLISPLQLTHAGDGSGRLFIVDQPGRIWIVDGGVVLPTPFLDVSSLLPTLNVLFDERGLLGLAFHPYYETNGYFYIRYSAPRVGLPGEPCLTDAFIPGCHSEVLARYQVSGDPNVANAGSGVILLSVDKPQWNHNAGHLAFDASGQLFVSLGDGGGANDGLADVPPSHGANGNGQNINSLLGKMLRIDVDAAFPYGVSATNPFFGATPGLDEIYAYGLRNPYRFSFDRLTDDLYVADAGQDLFEEINIVDLGGNYGWVIREASHCFDPFVPTTPPVTCPTIGAMGEPLIDPVSEYLHFVSCTIDSDCAAVGVGCDEIAGKCEDEGGLAAIGGYVYRGLESPTLAGKYIYGDFSADFGPTGRLYYFDTSGPNIYDRVQFAIGLDDDPLGKVVKGFGEDEVGEVYVLTSTALGPSGKTGSVFRILECIPEIYGNLVEPDNVVDLDDVVCILAGFANILDCPQGDIFPCGGGNGVIDLDDLIGLLLAFEEQEPLCPPQNCQ